MRLLNVVLGLVTGLGWQWSRMLEQRGLLEDPWAIYVGVAITLSFLAHQTLLQHQWPVSRSAVLKREPVVRVILDQLLKHYYAVLAADSGAAVLPVVRCNVMMPVKRCFGLYARMQIFYWECPDKTAYSREELNLKWSKKNGVIGWVWKRGQAEAFGISRSGAQVVIESLTREQRKALSTLKSIYSVPILWGGTVVALLTLDGDTDLDRTRFDCARIRDLVTYHCQVLLPLCFEEGVKG